MKNSSRGTAYGYRVGNEVSVDSGVALTTPIGREICVKCYFTSARQPVLYADVLIRLCRDNSMWVIEHVCCSRAFRLRRSYDLYERPQRPLPSRSASLPSNKRSAMPTHSGRKTPTARIKGYHMKMTENVDQPNYDKKARLLLAEYNPGTE